MIDLIEQLEENSAKFRLLAQDESRIKMNPIYSLLSDAEARREEDLSGVRKKQIKTLLRRYTLCNSLANEVLADMNRINNQLKRLKELKQSS